MEANTKYKIELKIPVRLLLAIVLSAGCTISVLAQATVSTTASVTILTPLSISAKQPMRFDAIGASEEKDGTLEITAGGDHNSTSGTNLNDQDSLYSQAMFTVTGEALYNYAIILPETIEVTNRDNTGSMTIGTLLEKPASGSELYTTIGTLAALNGTDSFTVGGTLIVPAGQLAGEYAGNFRVTVAFN